MGWYYEAEGISSSLKGSVLDFDNCSGAGRARVMARKESVEYPGAIYRTMTRRRPREPIFKDDADR